MMGDFEQISLFDDIRRDDKTVYVSPEYDEPDLCKTRWDRRLKVGDKISRVVLGECRISTITEVEGNERCFFYRTERYGCYTAEEGEQDIAENMRIAEENRKQFVTIEPEGLTDRVTVRYKPRKCDGRVLWAQVGYYGDLLYWKESITYPFLENIPDVKERDQLYKTVKKHMLNDNEDIAEYVDEIPMGRLYLCRNGVYSSAEYANFNGAVRNESEDNKNE